VPFQLFHYGIDSVGRGQHLSIEVVAARLKVIAETSALDWALG
jgi:hypothetical protein